MKLMTKVLIACMGLLLFIIGPIANAQTFRIKSIRFEGLQRVPSATALNYLPVRAGDIYRPLDSTRIIEALYETGFFTGEISLSRRGDNLIIRVQERPTIGLLRFTGNKLVKTDMLKKVLEQAGIQEGREYDDFVLQELKQSLEQEYYKLGRYNAKVTTIVTKQQRNRVAINITIYEGQVAKVEQIKIVGNCAFKTSTLLDQFQLSTPHIWSFIFGDDKFSNDKFQKDLESLDDFYKNRGYVKFKIDSAQVSLTPDRRHVYLTIHITEGDVYHLSGYRLSGTLYNWRNELSQLINIKQGDVFSRRKILGINNGINYFLADRGYANAQVQAIPDIDAANCTVFLNFEVMPGPRVYVNRINYEGNTKTNDNVLRFNTRQLEASLYSRGKINESTRLMNNLGYLQNVHVTTEPVPGKPNQVDLTYHVKEVSSASISAQAGYSDLNGFLLSGGVTENNFRGTGKTVSLNASRSNYVTSVNLAYYNPYYTVSGISRGFNFYAQHVTPNKVNITTYRNNVFGGSMTYGIPVSEYDRLTASLGFEHLNFQTGSGTSTQVLNFLNRYGTTYDQITVNLNWTHNTLDRAIFPTRGFHQLVAGTLGVPVWRSSLPYYKLVYDGVLYQPVAYGFIVKFKADLGYGDGYGRLDQLPFFRNFYGGGIGSLNGIQPNTLGPKDEFGNALGGNVLAVGSATLIMPEFLTHRVRTGIFLNAGNVYQTDSFILPAKGIDSGPVRFAAGIEIDWISPIGPLKFTLAKLLNRQPGDELDAFQFSASTSL